MKILSKIYQAAVVLFLVLLVPFAFMGLKDLDYLSLSGGTLSGQISVPSISVDSVVTCANPNIFRTASPSTGFFLSSSGATGICSLGTMNLSSNLSGIAIGPGGSFMSNGIVVYSHALTPVATAAAIGTTQQTFAVTGLVTTDKIYVNSLSVPTSLCPMTGYRVSAVNTLQLDFTTLTAVACTPVSATYVIIAIR